MNRRSTTRRRFLLGSTAGMVALAGCGGGDSTGNGNGNGDTNSTPASTPTTERRTTRASTPETTIQTTRTESEMTAEATVTEDSAESICAPLSAPPTSYDVSGTPYVFGFDYPDTWTVGEPLPIDSGRYQRVTSPDISDDGSGQTATVRVGQELDSLTAAEFEADVEEVTTRDTEPLTVVDEQRYDGESLRVFGSSDIDDDRYNPIYLLYLPHGSGDQRVYYRTALVTYTDIYGLTDEQSVSCNERIIAAARTILESLRPNPETTIDEV